LCSSGAQRLFDHPVYAVVFWAACKHVVFYMDNNISGNHVHLYAVCISPLKIVAADAFEMFLSTHMTDYAVEGHNFNITVAKT
jgi:hypothetical protein